jgi:hypothetical protein
VRDQASKRLAGYVTAQFCLRVREIILILAKQMLPYYIGKIRADMNIDGKLLEKTKSEKFVVVLEDSKSLF